MERIFSALKRVILSDLPLFLAKAEDKDTPLPTPAERDIVFGTVDIAKHGGKVVVSVLPEEAEDGDCDLVDYSTESRLLVTFIFQSSPYDVLVRQMCRYASAFRRLLFADPGIGGAAADSRMVRWTFHPDAGSVSRQMTAVEIEVSATTEEDDLVV